MVRRISYGAMTGGERLSASGPPGGSGWGEGHGAVAAGSQSGGRGAEPAPVGVSGPAAPRARSRRRPRGRRVRAPGVWLLLVVLAVQAALSARLIWADTAFDDEAMSLWAGHLEWAHWLHGT